VVGEIHVLLAAFLMFVALPMAAVSSRRGVGLNASILALGVSFWVAVVTGLAFVSSVRYAVLFAVAVIGLVLSSRWKRQPAQEADAAEPGSRALHMWDLFERPVHAARRISDRLRVRLKGSWQRFVEHYGYLGIAITLAALLWALAAGSWPWLHQVGPGTADGYDNLLRIASLASNTGVFSSGSAPTGVGAIGAALSTAFFLPPLNVLRFMYPLANMFTVLAAGVLAHQLTKSGRAAALVMFFVSVSSLAHLGFPVNFESPLALHWADILVLLGWAESVAWADNQDRSHAVFAGLCLLGASLTSPPEAVVGLLVAGAATVRRGGRVMLWGTVGVAAGLVPLAVGLLTGHPLSPDGWLQSGFPAVPPIWHNPKSSSYWLVWIAMALGVVNLFRPGESSTRRLFAAAVGGLGAAAAVLAWNSWAASVILWSGLLGVLVLVSGIDTLLVIAPGKMRWGKSGDVAVAGLAVLGAMLPSAAPQLNQYEPPLAAAATLRIEESLPPYQWTIVSPVSQYSEVLSRGWHEELSLFVQTYPLSDARSPRYHLKNDVHAPILTPNVFVFVEPRLFPTGVKVTRNDLTLPVATGSSTYSGRSLAAVESRGYFWARAYLKSHPHSARIYMRGRNLMVLWIRQ
jgi:hypothetical protein